MSFSPDQITSIATDEDERWKQTYQAIVNEVRRTKKDFAEDQKEARRLTAEIVATTRDEEKAALASDEAVAHGLSRMRKISTGQLEGLLEQPYFARVVTSEGGRDIEFKLGTASLPQERIIDWRQAPISKLFYDYQEGEEFAEEIQDREREGIVKLRRAFDGSHDNLKIIETAQGSLYKAGSHWKELTDAKLTSRVSGHDGHLPSILNLITPEQFDLITHHADRHLIIQGIAGSGKTSVALHRLAWLLHESNSETRADKTLVLLQSPSLKAYVATTLPELNVHNVAIKTYQQWSREILLATVGKRPWGNLEFFPPAEQFKSSVEIYNLLLEFWPGRKQQVSYTGMLFDFFNFLLQKNLPGRHWTQISLRLQEQVRGKFLQPIDDTLLLHMIFLHEGSYPTKNSILGLCDHIVLDEAQDFGLLEIRAVLNALKKNGPATIVGDTAQKIVEERNFESWQKILSDAGLGKTSPLLLNISHRTTQEIMDLAAQVREQGHKQQQSSKKHGPAPVFIRAESHQVLPNMIGKWIDCRVQESSRSLCAILCRWYNQAKTLFEQLRKLGYASVKWGERENFDFSPGIIITTVEQVKGLEFRNVLVIEPSEKNYNPARQHERNLLYVAITRAEIRLDFMGIFDPTPLLAHVATSNIVTL